MRRNPVEIEFLMRGNLHRGLDQAQHQAVQLDGILKRVGATVGIAFGTAQAVDFARKIMDVRGEVESLQMSFETLAGTSEGNKLFNDIKEFSVNTPMMMQDLAKGAQTLLAFDTEARNVMPILRQIGDISMGDAQKFNSLVLAFAQMSSTGKLMGQDLLQMINAGFNPLVVISEKTGKSMAQLKKDMGDGKITVEMVADAFATATAEGGKFHGMLEKQSKGIKGDMSNLQGAIDNALNDIGEKTQGVMMDGIGLATTLAQNYEKVLDVLAQIVIAYGSYKAALMTITAIEKARNMADMIRLVMMYRKEMGLLTAAQKAFNLECLKNPYVLIAAAVAAAAVSIYKLATADNAAEAAQKDLNETIEKGNKLLKEHQEELDRLTATANDEAASTTARTEAMQELINKYPGIIKKYIDEKGHLRDILDLKYEIAMLDGKQNVKDLEDERNKGQRYLELYNKAHTFGGKMTESEREEYNRMTGDVWDKQGFWTKMKNPGSPSDFVLKYYQKELPGLQKAVARANTENVLREFNHGLTKKTDQELQAMMSAAKRQLGRLNEKTIAARDLYTNDYLREADYAERIATISSILDKRHPTNTTTTTKPTKGKTALETQTEQKQKEADAQAELDKYTRNMIRANLQSELEIRQSRLDNEKDSVNKEVEQIRLNYDKLLFANEQRRDQMIDQMKAAERKQWEKDNPNAAKEGKVFKSGITADNLSEDQKKILSEYDRVAEEYRKSATASVVKDITNQYIKDYGTYQQKRELIITEGNEKISRLMRQYEEQEDEGVRAAIRLQIAGARKEMEKGVSDLDMSHLQKSIDWEAVFNDMDKISTERLRELKEKLKAALNAKDITAENAKVLSEKIREIEDKIVVRTDFLAQLLPGLRERKRLASEAAAAEAAYKKAVDDEAAAFNKVLDTKKKIKEALDGVDIRDALGQKISIELEAISEENKDRLLESLDKGSDLYKALLKLFENLAADNQEHQQAVEKKTTRLEDVNKKLLKMKGGWGDWFNIQEGTFVEIFQRANENIQSLKDITETLGLADTDFGKFVGEFCDSSQHFTDAIGQLASGNVIGALDSVIQGVASMGEAIGGIFGLGGADYSELDAAKQRYEQLSGIWDTLLDKKREYLGMSWGIEAQNASEEAMELLRTKREQNEILARMILGSGASAGSHSIRYRMWEGSYGTDMSDNSAKYWNGGSAATAGYVTWNDVNHAIERGIKDAGLGNVTFNSMDDLLKMNAEQLEWIMRNYEGLWVHMDGDFRQALENIIEFSDTEADILEKTKERILGTSFDSFFDGYMSHLMEMKEGTADITDAIEEDFDEMMNNMLVKAIMGDTYKARLRKWYDQWYAAWEEGNDLNSTEIQDLKNEYMNITQDAMSQLEALRKNGIIKNIENAYSQSGRSGGFNAMSQEMGTKLEGTFTSGLRHWASMDEELSSVADGFGKALDHLKEIADNTKISKGFQKDIKELIEKIMRDGIKMK